MRYCATVSDSCTVPQPVPRFLTESAALASVIPSYLTMLLSTEGSVRPSELFEAIHSSDSFEDASVCFAHIRLASFLSPDFFLQLMTLRTRDTRGKTLLAGHPLLPLSSRGRRSRHLQHRPRSPLPPVGPNISPQAAAARRTPLFWLTGGAGLPFLLSVWQNFQSRCAGLAPRFRGRDHRLSSSGQVV